MVSAPVIYHHFLARFQNSLVFIDINDVTDIRISAIKAHRYLCGTCFHNKMNLNRFLDCNLFFLPSYISYNCIFGPLKTKSLIDFISNP